MTNNTFLSSEVVTNGSDPGIAINADFVPVNSDGRFLACCFRVLLVCSIFLCGDAMLCSTGVNTFPFDFHDIQINGVFMDPQSITLQKDHGYSCSIDQFGCYIIWAPSNDEQACVAWAAAIILDFYNGGGFAYNMYANNIDDKYNYELLKEHYSDIYFDHLLCERSVHFGRGLCQYMYVRRINPEFFTHGTLAYGITYDGQGHAAARVC